MNFQITTQTFRFLEHNFLNDLKQQAASRSKPSKTVLEALKHSTSLNKSLKSQVKTLQSQLSASVQEKYYLKSVIDSLKEEIQSLKNSQYEKIKKLSKAENQRHNQIQFLTKQNYFLKTQIGLLKQKAPINAVGLIEKEVMRNQCIKREKEERNQFLDTKNINENMESRVSSSIPLQQHESFGDYVNFKQGQEKNQQTRANSKLRIEFYEQQQFQTPKIDKVNNEESEQLSAMLSLRKDSKEVSPFFDDISHCDKRVPSIESLSPEMVAITSQQQIYIEQFSKIQTPTLQKCRFNPTESKFKVFQDELKHSIEGSYRGCKRTDITFLNLITNKSIEQTLGKSSNNEIQNVIAKKSIQQKEQYGNVQIQNFSGLDSHRIMGDICREELNYQLQGQNKKFYQDQNEDQHEDCNEDQHEDCNEDQHEDCNEDQHEDCNEDCNEDQHRQYNIFYKTQGFNRLGNAIQLQKIKAKRSSSQLYSPQKTKTIIDQLRGPSEQSGLLSIDDNIPQSYSRNLPMQKNFREQRLKVPLDINRTQKQKEKATVHAPIKYMSIAESFKTIELNRSIHPQKSNQNKSFKRISKINETERSNGSSVGSRDNENSESICSKSQTNSKYMRHCDSRKNKQKKSLSPLSIENQVNQGHNNSVKQQNKNQRIPKSYSLTQSVHLKKTQTLTPKNQASLNPICKNELYPLPNTSSTMNYSSFRKRINDSMTQITHPIVTFKDIEDEVQLRSYRFNDE